MFGEAKGEWSGGQFDFKCNNNAYFTMIGGGGDPYINYIKGKCSDGNTITIGDENQAVKTRSVIDNKYGFAGISGSAGWGVNNIIPIRYTATGELTDGEMIGGESGGGPFEWTCEEPGYKLSGFKGVIGKHLGKIGFHCSPGIKLETEKGVGVRRDAHEIKKLTCAVNKIGEHFRFNDQLSKEHLKNIEIECSKDNIERIPWGKGKGIEAFNAYKKNDLIWLVIFLLILFFVFKN